MTTAVIVDASIRQIKWIAFGGRNSALAKRKPTNGSIIIDWQSKRVCVRARVSFYVIVALRASPPNDLLLCPPHEEFFLSIFMPVLSLSLSFPRHNYKEPARI